MSAEDNRRDEKARVGSTMGEDGLEAAVEAGVAHTESEPNGAMGSDSAPEFKSPVVPIDTIKMLAAVYMNVPEVVFRTTLEAEHVIARLDDPEAWVCIPIVRVITTENRQLGIIEDMYVRAKSVLCVGEYKG